MNHDDGGSRQLRTHGYFEGGPDAEKGGDGLAIMVEPLSILALILNDKRNKENSHSRASGPCRVFAC